MAPISERLDLALAVLEPRGRLGAVRPADYMREMARRGLAVIPVDGKKPLVDEWQRRGVPTDDELDGWERSWPRANYGILTGSASGIDCFDFDVAGNGWALMATWCALVDVAGPIPPTWAQTTGNGLHVFIEHVPGARSAQSVAGVPVEYKADGRQVVGPGSIHPSGKVYAECEPLPIAALPDPGRLIEALNRHTPPTAASAAPTPIGPPQAPRRVLRRRGRLSGAQALERATARIATARIGTRDDTLNRETYYLGPYVAAGELDRAELEDTCSAAAAKTALEAREIAATLRSALMAGIRDSAPLEAVCEHPPDPSPRRGMTRAGRQPRRPLTPWAPEALTPALALIARTAPAAAWDWDGAEADRRVFDSLMGRAQDAGESLEVEAPLRWLSEQTGIHTHYVRASLSRLVEHGWLTLTRQGGPTGQHSVRAPSAYRLRIPAGVAVVPPIYAPTRVAGKEAVTSRHPTRAPVGKIPIGGSSAQLVSSERESLGVEVDPRGGACVGGPPGLLPRSPEKSPDDVLGMGSEEFRPPSPGGMAVRRASHPGSAPPESEQSASVLGIEACWAALAAGGQGRAERPVSRVSRRHPPADDRCEAERARQLAALAAWDPVAGDACPLAPG